MIGVALNPSGAAAGQIYVESADPVVVSIDGSVAGEAPLEIPDVSGRYRLGFRATPFGADLFHQDVEVAGDGAIRIIVDLEARRATVAPDVRPETPARQDASPEAHPVPGGDIFVSATEEGASIVLDGLPTGLRTPAMLVQVPVGPHEVGVRTTCGRAAAVVDVLPDRIVRVDGLTLELGSGTLDVRAEPEGSAVWIDGVEVGVTPLEHEVSCGPHTIEVRASGFLSATGNVAAPAFERTEWTALLEPEAYGTLVVAVQPLAAIVAVDGVALAPGPATIEGIAAGAHEVTVAASGYRDEVRTIDIAADEVTRLDLALLPVASARRGAAAGRLVLNGVVTAAGLAGLGLAAADYVVAKRAYGRFLTEPSDHKATDIYDDEVAPRQTRAIVEGVAGGVLLVGGGLLWSTTEFTQAQARSPGVVVRGRW